MVSQASRGSSGAESDGPRVRILGIDPGIARVGWGVIEEDGRQYRLVEYGSVKTTRESPHPERLLSIFEGLRAVIAEHEPQTAIVEEVFQSKSPKSAFLAGEGRSACILAAATRGIQVVEYPATLVKMAITGNGRAVKQQVQAMVQRLLQLEKIPRPHDAADALALALTYGQRTARSPVVRRD